MTITLQPFTRSDLPRMKSWLAQPHIVIWWGDPEREYALILEDLDVPQMQMFLICEEDEPIGYIQHYDVHHWDAPHYKHLPRGSRAVDMFIAKAGKIGRGLGSTALRLLSEQLLATGAPCVAIDPDPANARARAAYRKAGFVGEDIVESEDGPAVLMVKSPAECPR